METIAPLLLAWWDAGHADLPWRQTRDPYLIWVSEIMLQQTQIATVIPYYNRWLAQFPTINALAEASVDDVLKLWEGLGYYSRARNLHAAAQIVSAQYGGVMPRTAHDLQKLPGIGRYTAAAIASIAYDEPVAVLDGNVIRVLTRLFDIADDVTVAATKRLLWDSAEKCVPDDRPGAYNQALMELGQRICITGSPECHRCPLTRLCLAQQRGTQMERPVRPPRKRIPHFDVVAGIITRDDGRFLITQRPRDGMLGGLWEFPGGKREPGETLSAALVREIGEELGIDITVGRALRSIKHAYTHFRITLHPFEATWEAGDVQHLGVTDHAWVTVAEVDHYAFAVTDRKIIKQIEAGAQQMRFDLE
ncbi:MAG: A/G-specific adenine glycosylase [Anaerolineae bacterium]|nr:A/G-specific adenine glycosylase [Anaerolineae bacterium]